MEQRKQRGKVYALNQREDANYTSGRFYAIKGTVRDILSDTQSKYGKIWQRSIHNNALINNVEDVFVLLGLKLFTFIIVLCFRVVQIRKSPK